jgi:hypothetical protein
VTDRPRPRHSAVLGMVLAAMLLLWLLDGRAQQIAGNIEYTTDDDYPALCAGRELDSHGRPVVARIGMVDGVVRITATSCDYIFGGGFER